MQNPGCELTFAQNLSISAAEDLVRRMQAIPGFSALVSGNGTKQALPAPQLELLPQAQSLSEEDAYLKDMNLEQLMITSGILPPKGPATQAESHPQPSDVAVAGSSGKERIQLESGEPSLPAAANGNPNAAGTKGSEPKMNMDSPAASNGQLPFKKRLRKIAPKKPVAAPPMQPLMQGEGQEVLANGMPEVDDSGIPGILAENEQQLPAMPNEPPHGKDKKSRRKNDKPKKNDLFDLGFSVDSPTEVNAHGDDATSETSEIEIVNNDSKPASNEQPSCKKPPQENAPKAVADSRMKPLMEIQEAKPKTAPTRKRKAPTASHQRLLTLDADFLAPVGSCPFDAVGLSGDLQPAKGRNGTAVEGLIVKRVRLEEGATEFSNEGGLLLLNVQPGVEGSFAHEGFKMKFSSGGHKFHLSKKK